MQRDVEFDAEGVTRRGWLFTPDEGAGPFPTIVMAHGISCVKEMHLDDFARVFVDAGFAAPGYDNRCFGASDGQPLQEIDSWVQIRDDRHACTSAESRDVVDSDLTGIWAQFSHVERPYYEQFATPEHVHRQREAAGPWGRATG